MANKIKIAGLSAVYLFAVLGAATAAWVIWRAPWTTVLFLLAWFAVYENLSQKRPKRTALFRQISRIRPDDFLKRAGRVEIEKGKPGEPDYWFRNPRFQALMDLGFSSDQARDEIARQTRYAEE